MTTSSFSSLPTRSCSVESTTAAGTISQIARGFCSFLTKSSNEVEPVAPSPSNCFTESALRSYTTHLCPFFCNRRTMLAPILPSPIMPSCIASAPLCLVSETLFASSGERLLHCSCQCREPALQVFPEMGTQGTAAAFGKNGKIAAGLPRLHDSKRVLLSRNRQVLGVVAGNLQENAAIRAAFIGLSRRMQEARAKAENCGHFFLVAHGMPHALQSCFICRIHGDVAEHGEIIARTGAREMCLKNVGKLRAAL